MSCEEIKERLNAELTSELQALEVYPAERKFSEIAYATYEYTFHTPNASEALVQSIQQVLSQRPLTVVKRSKSGEREVDLQEYLQGYAVSLEGNDIRLVATLSAGEGNYLTPEALVGILREKIGLMAGDPLQQQYRILRRQALLADGKTVFA
jgi:hypothetical protein